MDLKVDTRLVKEAKRIEIKRFKKTDKVKLFFSNKDPLAWRRWEFKCHVDEIPDKELREEILRKGIFV